MIETIAARMHITDREIIREICVIKIATSSSIKSMAFAGMIRSVLENCSVNRYEINNMRSLCPYGRYRLRLPSSRESVQ